MNKQHTHTHTHFADLSEVIKYSWLPYVDLIDLLMAIEILIIIILIISHRFLDGLVRPHAS